MCLRARLSPSNFPSEGIFIGLFFPTIFLLFGGKTALLKPSLSDFFSVVSKEGNEEEEINTKNYYGASTSSVDDSLYVILFFRRKEE